MHEQNQTSAVGGSGGTHAVFADSGAGDSGRTTMYVTWSSTTFSPNGRPAAPSWTATIWQKGSSRSNQTVTSPTVVGYEPDQATVDVTVNNITENKTYTVTYHPANVGFTVNHYLQNVADNNYTLNVSERHDGFTESEVGDGLAKTVHIPALQRCCTIPKPRLRRTAAPWSRSITTATIIIMSFNLNGGYRRRAHLCPLSARP